MLSLLPRVPVRPTVHKSEQATKSHSKGQDPSTAMLPGVKKSSELQTPHPPNSQTPPTTRPVSTNARPQSSSSPLPSIAQLRSAPAGETTPRWIHRQRRPSRSMRLSRSPPRIRHAHTFPHWLSIFWRMESESSHMHGAGMEVPPRSLSIRVSCRTRQRVIACALAIQIVLSTITKIPRASARNMLLQGSTASVDSRAVLLALDLRSAAGNELDK